MARDGRPPGANLRHAGTAVNAGHRLAPGRATVFMAAMIRPETPADAAAIRRLTDAAFAGAPHASGTEGAIIDALRAEGTLALSLVAEEDGRIVGHAAFSPVAIGGADAGWLGLGPVSVLPLRQRTGIGTRLVRDGLARLRADGAGGCVVLGDPAWYRRLGFENDPGLTFDGAPAAYFLRLSFGETVPAGAVTYRPAFYAD